uniref:UDP-N-acetyl-D-mannosaminuronic acid dehydrogenase n=1 Tax=Candidatus Kentrum sp. FM TaxID=2126340 RepID=A0A450TJP6_9GAMM|nr:MAG: UDP-N-acetyl-D-mannosaminuronic acid dehydrogenase [Candidatus Kentron sp. FM]VFJ67638.1 MAG: UDP-N-acetyl-D-mannosaminuronic acid dehydrogenase [Candidatus Kentron sp. FM]VFK21703.1 MAG: UDP-N-acetyl-D-mannosaminuronic acid dehydrogenase [Candidatus Kentron sp. FM]
MRLMNNKTICVVGLGYIGLPTAALLASNGYRVIGADRNTQVVETINQGRIHIVEPALKAFVHSAVIAGQLEAFTTPQPANVYIICVPTPFHEGEAITPNRRFPGLPAHSASVYCHRTMAGEVAARGAIPQPNIDYVLEATRSIMPLIKPGDLLILESTSPVGTTRQLAELLGRNHVDVSDIHIAYCPERVLPGKTMTELVENDRVVGGLTPEATRAVGAFYRTFVHGQVLETDAPTAEMCKLAENSFRDVNIAFANELSLICAREGIDVRNLIQLANRHPRVDILQPGTGVGGHCIAVDPWFIIARNPEDARLMRTAREVNDAKTEWVIDRIKIAAADASAAIDRKPRVACLGLSFKPDIGDLRRSPALHTAMTLQSQGYDVVAVEPNCDPDDYDSNNELPLLSLASAIETAHVVAVLVKHRQFIEPVVRRDLQAIGALDFCGIYT